MLDGGEGAGEGLEGAGAGGGKGGYHRIVISCRKGVEGG